MTFEMLQLEIKLFLNFQFLETFEATTETARFSIFHNLLNSNHKAATITEMESLKKRVQDDSQFFDRMLDLIPAKFYLHPEQTDEELIKVRH